MCAAITHVLDIYSSCAGLLGGRSEDSEWQPPVGAISSAEERQEEDADDASGGWTCDDKLLFVTML